MGFGKGKLKPFEDEICKLYTMGYTTTQLAKRYGCDVKAITYLLKKRGVAIRPKTEYRKYGINDTYFDNLDSDSKLYILGFITADGYIRRDKINSLIKFHIHKQDREILEFIRSEICPEKPIHQYDEDHLTLIIHSKRLVDRLYEIGITQAKSKTIKYPNCIPEEFHGSFIRGLFDGDGSIGMTDGSLRWYLVGTYDICNRVQEIFAKELGLNKTKLYYDGSVYRLQYCGNIIARRIYEYLYRDASFSLDRKREKFEQFFGGLVP